MPKEAAASQIYASAIPLTVTLELKALNIDSIFTTALQLKERLNMATNTSDRCS